MEQESMDLIEIETARQMGREEAAKWLHQLADSLERHNEVSFKQEGLQFRVRVPDEVTVEVELEIGDDGSSVEFEVKW
jgi:amphi-Trp domain-containing protein